MNNIDLSAIIPPATVMVVTVTGSTTSGQKLPESDLKSVIDACDMAINLEQAKRELLSYVEARMNFIAPNLTAITGSGIAAKLMGTAGGLTNLSKMPACNILVCATPFVPSNEFSSLFFPFIFFFLLLLSSFWERQRRT